MKNSVDAVSNRPLAQGILILDKEMGRLSFSLVSWLRKFTGQPKVGHAGTLDPFATGVMVMLLGTPFTKMATQFLQDDKEYLGTIRLGVETDTYDSDGQILSTTLLEPTVEEVEEALTFFQGKVLQVPPMFSAKKIGGKKLCDLARQGKNIEREAVTLEMKVDLLAYEYPYIRVKVRCSKGTYVRSIAHDLGKKLGTGAHLSALRRTRSGVFCIEQATTLSALQEDPAKLFSSMIQSPLKVSV